MSATSRLDARVLQLKEERDAYREALRETQSAVEAFGQFLAEYKEHGLSPRLLNALERNTKLLIVLVMLALAGSGQAAESTMPMPITASIEHASSLPGNAFAEPYKIHTYSRAWEWAPVGCKIVDAGTALWGRRHVSTFNEVGPVARHLIDKPAGLVAMNVGMGLATKMLVGAVLKSGNSTVRASGKVLSIGSCASSLYFASTNVRGAGK